MNIKLVNKKTISRPFAFAPVRSQAQSSFALRDISKCLKDAVCRVALVVGVTGLFSAVQSADAQVTYNSFFNASFYATENPDVVAVFGNNPSALLSHWINYGISEGRSGNPKFSPLVVASNPPYEGSCGSRYVIGRPSAIYGQTVWYQSVGDIRCAVEQLINFSNQYGGPYQTYGFNALGSCRDAFGGAYRDFNPSGYLRVNLDVANFCASGPSQLIDECATRHFIEYGRWEGRYCS